MIFRGEEYTRAIQKYQRTLNLLPNSADDLLSSNGTRFLRKAYADPVSGEPWRVIILNADGTLTGSNVYPIHEPGSDDDIRAEHGACADGGDKAPRAMDRWRLPTGSIR